MFRIRAWLRRVNALVRRDRFDDQLREEIDAHIAARCEQLIAEGMDPVAAAAAARRSFGNVTKFREETRAMWSFPTLDSVGQDLRYGARLLWHAPWFTGVAVLSLVVGIGCAATVFTIADAVLLRPLAVRAPGQLRELRAIVNLGGTPRTWRAFPRMPSNECRSGPRISHASSASGRPSTSRSRRLT